MESIRITPGFCPNCGSILPYLRETGSVKCYNCLTDWPADGKFPSPIFVTQLNEPMKATTIVLCFSVWWYEIRIHNRLQHIHKAEECHEKGRRRRRANCGTSLSKMRQRENVLCNTATAKCRRRADSVLYVHKMQVSIESMDEFRNKQSGIELFSSSFQIQGVGELIGSQYFAKYNSNSIICYRHYTFTAFAQWMKNQ